MTFGEGIDIRTIITKRAEIAVPFCLPGNHEQLNEQLPAEAVVQMKMLDFFSGTSDELNKYNK